MFNSHEINKKCLYNFVINLSSYIDSVLDLFSPTELCILGLKYVVCAGYNYDLSKMLRGTSFQNKKPI